MKNPFVPTSRDKAILRFLHSYALSRTNDLAAEFFPGVAATTVLRRLRVLEQLGFIARLSFLRFGQVVWRVTERGARLVAEDTPRLHFSQQNIPHDLEVAIIRRLLEKSRVAHSWEAEHAIRRRIRERYGNSRDLAQWTVPDGIMTVRRSQKEVQFAVEVELNFKNRDRYRKILRDYARKNELEMVWYLVASPAIGKVLQETWNRIDYPQCLFIWTLIDDLKKSPWEATVNHSKGTCYLRQVCDRPSEIAPAQAPAQDVSGSASS